MEGLLMPENDRCLPKPAYAKEMILSACKNLYKLNPIALKWMERRIDNLIKVIRFEAQMDREGLECSIQELFENVAKRNGDTRG